MKQRILLISLFILSINLVAQTTKDSIPKKWTVKGEFQFLFNQSNFSHWKAGGENTLAGNVSVNYDFNYKNGLWNWDNKIITVYGLSHIKDRGTQKTSDRFEYNSVLGKKTTKNWFFSFLTNIKTQFSRGYDYKASPRRAISNFFAPAYITFGPGMLWKKSDQLFVNIAPATTRLILVSDEFSGNYGVEEGKNSQWGLGFNLSGYYKFKLFTNVTMENILAVYSDYLNQPENVDIDYQININMLVNKHMSMAINLHMIVDDNASSRVQFKEVFGLGLRYVFHQI